MNKALITLLGLLLLSVLGYFCINIYHTPNIQSDIHARTSAALTEQGLGYVNVGTDGRDIVLTGVIASEAIRQQAGEFAKNVYGVRIVDNQLTITAAEPVVESKPDVKPESVEMVVETPRPESLVLTCQQDFDVLLSSNAIKFATNSADIDATSNSLLGELIEVANQCPEAKIEIAGHTDSRGSDDYNLRLSQKRASSVMRYLINSGINATRLSAVGYGETRPIADNENEEGMTKNRRIEFNVEGLSQ